MQQQNQYRLIVNDPHSGITPIENIFITEYMPRANPAYVKVYLYGLMAAGNPRALTLDNAKLADLFGITEGDVVNAWQYWEDQGILEICFSGQDQYVINFFNINEVLLRGKPKQKRPAPADDLYDPDVEAMFERIQIMYGGRMISRADMMTFMSWIEDYHFDTGTVVLLVEYVLNILSAKDSGYSEAGSRNYMKKIADIWHQEGICNYHQAEIWLTENKKRRRLHFKVMRALGLNRNPTQSEIEIIDTWQKGLECSDEVIEYALKRTTKPSVQYVNSILKHWSQKGWKTVVEIQKKDQYHQAKKISSGKLSEEDKQTYREKQQRDDVWIDSVEDNFDEIYRKLHGNTGTH